MTTTPADAVIIEEIEIEKPTSGAWYVFGVLAVLAVIFGVRTVRKNRREKQAALSETPTA